MLLLSFNCHCACATTDESQQQHYTVTTIIKRLMITKILNKLCRFICMLLLLCNWSFIEKTSVKQSKKQQVCSIFLMTCTDQMYPPPPIDQRSMEYTTLNKFCPPPPPIDHRSMEYHYTKSVSHIAECTYTQGRCNPLLQSTIDLWKTTTLNKFHI